MTFPSLSVAVSGCSRARDGVWCPAWLGLLGALAAAGSAVGSVAGCAGADEVPAAAPLTRTPSEPGLTDGGTVRGSDRDDDAGSDGEPSTEVLEACDGAGPNPLGITAPDADTEVDNFRFDLASDSPRSVTGTVLSVDIVRPLPVVTRALLVATGAFLEDGCLVEQDGASYSWQGVACQSDEGTLLNVLVVEPSALAGATRWATRGTTVRLSGYEIERFNDFSPGGGWRDDGGDNGEQGQVSLWLTRVCTP